MQADPFNPLTIDELSCRVDFVARETIVCESTASVMRFFSFSTDAISIINYGSKNLTQSTHDENQSVPGVQSMGNNILESHTKPKAMKHPQFD